jgi:hypothetical protein
MGERFGPNSNIARLLLTDKRYERARILASSLMMQVNPKFRGTREELVMQFIQHHGQGDWFRAWTYLNDAANDTGIEGISAMVELRQLMKLPPFRTFTTVEASK